MTGKWIFTAAYGYDSPQAFGYFDTEEEAMRAAYHNEFGSAFVPPTNPEEYQTVQEWYVDTDDIWVMQITDVATLVQS